MSSPKRWLNGEDELTGDELRVLGADIGRASPTHAKSAVRAALAVKLAAVGAAAAAPKVLKGSAWPGATAQVVSLSVLKSAAVGFAVSAVVSAGFSLHEPQNGASDAARGAASALPPAPSAPARSAPASSGAELEPKRSPAPNDALPNRIPHRAMAREAPGEVPPAPTSRSASESQRVAHARALLRSGQSSEALQVLQALERDEPDGLLAQEREALAIETLAALGRPDAVRQRAAAFALRYPASPHLAAVRRASQ